MHIRQLLRSMLPGMLPLFIFIAADEIWGTTIGLYVAVSVGVVELLIIGVVQKRFDKFVLFDTLLIVAMGGVSIILSNDIFFKLKPGIIGVILSAFLGISAYSNQNLLMKMSGRYLRGIEINEMQQKQMQQSMRLMFWIFVAHTILVFISAFLMSKAAWAFISGGLFYILFAIVMLIEWLRAKGIIKSRNKIQEEILPLVNPEGKIIGKVPRSIAHSSKEYMHPVVHLHIINASTQVYLQKRSLQKEIQAGMWDTAVGGHVAWGETIEQSLMRETEEEAGLTNFKPIPMARYIWESEIEKELVYSFICYAQIKPVFEDGEIDDGKYWSFAEIRKNLNNGVFTPNFIKEFEILEIFLKKHKNQIKKQK